MRITFDGGALPHGGAARDAGKTQVLCARSRLSVAILGCLLSGAGYSAPVVSEAQTLPTVRMKAFVEKQSDQVNVAGVPILGVTTDGASEAAALTPALRVPAALLANGTSLCIETTSVDGGYTSRGEVDASDIAAARGRFRLAYNDRDDPSASPRFKEALHRYQPPAMATMAIVGGCGANAPLNRFVVIDRRAPGSSDAALLLQVNASQYDIDVEYRTRDGASRQVGCEPIPGEARRVAFSAICRLPGPFAESTTVTLARSRYGRSLPPLTFTLLFPQGENEAASNTKQP